MKELSLVLFFIFFSCNERNIPKCNDKNVKQIALAILKQKLNYPLILKYSNSNFELSDVESADASPNDYVFTVKQREIAEKYSKNILDSIKLSNIVTINSNGSNKCSCESHIEIEYLGSIKIKYETHLTDDDKTFVTLKVTNE